MNGRYERTDGRTEEQEEAGRLVQLARFQSASNCSLFAQSSALLWNNDVCADSKISVTYGNCYTRVGKAGVEQIRLPRTINLASTGFSTGDYIFLYLRIPYIFLLSARVK